MSKLLKKENLGPETWRCRFHAPHIAKKRQAGQFIILCVARGEERIPLTIVDSDPEEGWIEIIFKALGIATQTLAKLNAGDSIQDLVGPLGKSTHVNNFGNCICIGGGVGIAPLYPIIKALKTANNNVTTIIGAKNSSLLILQKEMATISDQLFIVTDDGSSGEKGFVSHKLEGLLEDHMHFDYAIIIGPPAMMKTTAKIALNAGILTYVSLNPVMIDGIGMCGGCRVNIGGKTYFACIDGPEFNAALIDWPSLERNLSNYNHRLFPDHTCYLTKKNNTK